jgi:hypothetical protein
MWLLWKNLKGEAMELSSYDTLLDEEHEMLLLGIDNEIELYEYKQERKVDLQNE